MTATAATLLLISLFLGSCQSSETEGRDYYQLKIYHLSESDPERRSEQEKTLDQYLADAFIPAMHRAGIGSIGVFKPLESLMEELPMVMILVPYSSLKQFEEMPRVLLADQQYREDGAAYLEASHDNPPYQRIESVLLRAFENTPRIQLPDHPTPRNQRVYELRSYEGATEALYRRKVEMFNEGESALFRRLGFQPVFFAEVLSSGRMPHLMYMTTFSDTVSHQEHWDRFRNDPEWLDMKDLERYQNTVSHIDRYLLRPAPYSDY